MPIRMMSRDLPLGLASLLLLTLAGCGGMTLESRWAGPAPTIDGDDADWTAGRYAPEKVPAVIGVTNDGRFLYLSMSTTDPEIQQRVLMGGFEIWLDPKGGKKKYFGVRVAGIASSRMSSGPGGPGEFGREDDGDDAAPDGTASTGGPFGGGRIRGEGGMRGGGRPHRPTPEETARLLSRLTKIREITVLTSADDQGWTTVPAPEDPLQVRLGMEEGRFVCEARLPLEYLGNPHYAVALGAKASVGVGLRTGDVALGPGLGRGPGRGSPGGMGPGGMGGGFGGRGGGGMGRGPGGMGGGPGAGPQDESGNSGLDLWAKVKLARSGGAG